MARYDIVLDNKAGVFTPGQLITGRVELELTKETKARAIYLVFRASAEVHWTETYKDKDGKRQTKHYRNSEMYVNEKISLYGKEETGENQTKIQPGNYVYPFELQVPENVPSSYEAKIGYVRYMLKSYIDIPWGFDKKTKRMITVARILNLNSQPGAADSSTVQDEKTLCCLCCESDPISATLTTDRRGYVPGESITFKAEINNQSKRRISNSKALLVMCVSYHARGKTRYVVNCLDQLEHDEIEPGGTDQWTGEKIHVPAVPPSFLQGCNIIDINYFLNLKVIPSGLAFDLVLQIEMFIGTISLSSVAKQHGLKLPPTLQDPSLTGVPDNLYSAYIMPSELPNVKMVESAMGRMSTREDDDTEETYGATDFAPVYTYYNWDKPDPNNTVSVKINEDDIN